jgi:tol-pal system protein YbgF
MGFRLFCLQLSGAAAWFGCAHAPAPQPSIQIEDLRRRLSESQGRESELQRKVDELSNRLFILQDQLEAREVAAQRKAPVHLPVDARADAPAPGEDAADAVEYAGAARDAHAPRPVLRLVGSQAVRGTSDSEVVGERSDRGPSAPSTGHRTARNDWRPPEPAVAEDPGDRLPVTRSIPPIPHREGEGTSAPVVHAPAAPVPPPPLARQDPASQPVRALARAGGPGKGGSDVEAMKLYNSSVELLRHGQHAEAIAGLHRFIEVYPTHDYADNAQYWLGECYYDQKDFKTALREFRRVVQRYPTGNKAPDALLKVGFCYWQLQDSSKARDVLDQVVKSYPGTDIARKAQDKLSELK